MHWGSRAFVFLLFAILAASFWATTISLYTEFADPQKPFMFNGELWFTLLTHYSDLFIFFPLFGTVALIAFYTPACAFVDMYWNVARQIDDPIPQSRFRFAFWFVAIAGFSYAISYAIQVSEERAIWQLSPSVLQADKGEDCDENQCGRVSFVDGLANVRRASRSRLKLTDLTRACRSDNFVAPPREPPSDRYCAPTTNFQGQGGDLPGRLLNDELCCFAQFRFDAAVKAAHELPQNRSQTDTLQLQLWPLNMFFLFTLLAISVLLALRRPRIERFYGDYARHIDRGVIVGVMAMAFLTIMNRGFLEATQLLHGSRGAESLHRDENTFIVVFAIWALLILFSFFHPANKQAELTSRFLGVVFSVLFVFNAETITNYGIRYFGAGAGPRSLAMMMAIALCLLSLTFILARVQMTVTPDDKDKAQPGNDIGADQPRLGRPSDLSNSEPGSGRGKAFN
ncbi:MAG: hypothetical protein ACR2PG_02810 [Hyphomicrobiaceae bacterium]